VTLLGGCIFVKVREHDPPAGGPADATLQLAASAESCSTPAPGGEPIKAAPVASHAIGDIPGKTLTSILLTVPPHATANAHRHAGVVFGYVIEGMVCSQITGDASLKPFRAGESFFEAPGSQHLAFVNPGAAAAKILVTQVADTGATLTMPLP
jgi:quercetin dioxygenase-like cupin family protein